LEIVESKNEPNICRGWTVETNLKMIGELAEIRKKYNLSFKLAGPDPLGTDLTWISNVLAGKEAKALDIITAHPYRNLPELPDYADDVESVRKIIALKAPGKPYYGTEAGRCQPAAWPTGYIDPQSLNATARDIRNILQGRISGEERYYQFCFSLWPDGTQWAVMMGGNHDNDDNPVPNLTLYGMRAMADLLENAKPVTRVRLGVNYRCGIFDHGKKRTAVIWKWNGPEGTLDFSPEDAAKLTAYDMFGARIPAASLAMAEQPVYLDSTLGASQFEALIRRGRLQSAGPKVDFNLAVIGESKFAVDVKNLTGQPLHNVKLQVHRGENTKETSRTLDVVKPEMVVRSEFPLGQKIDRKGRKVKVSVACEGEEPVVKEEVLKGILARKVSSPLKIDGNLSDWPATVQPIVLDKRDVDPKCLEPEWGTAEENIRAELRYAWDDYYLYVSVVVFKPTLHQLQDRKLFTNGWQYDSVQIDFDTVRNAQPNTLGLQDDDFEYCLQPIAGRPVVSRRWASAVTYDSLPKASGIISSDEVPFAFKKLPDRMVYEFAFARRAVSPFQLRAYSAMRMSLIVNVNNGQKRVGFLQLTPGLGQNPKRPGQWMDFVLLP
ncbi:MAG: hypothetical protein IJJ26_10200, partial [Victivallales bacterium]|nr:hypothetical protein [Victivallales bacterium]